MSTSLTTTSFVDSGRRVINLKGELDLATAAQAGEALSHGFEVLDLGELEFLDSTGLRILLQASQALDCKPVLRGARGQVRRILELSGMTTVFVIEQAAPPDGVAPTSLN